RAIDVEPVCSLGGGILQFVQPGPLRWRGLDGLRDTVDREVGAGGRLLIAELREIVPVLAGGVGVIRRRDGVEARLLLVAERLVEALERRTYGLHSGKHDLQPALHRREPSGRDARQVLWAPGPAHVDG